MTRDITLYPLVIHNVSLFPSQVNSRIVPDSTVLIDFLYFIHPVSQHNRTLKTEITASYIAAFIKHQSFLLFADRYWALARAFDATCQRYPRRTRTKAGATTTTTNNVLPT